MQLKKNVHGNENMKVLNITFFCNRLRGTMKLFIIMDEYSTVINGLLK